MLIKEEAAASEISTRIKAIQTGRVPAGYKRTKIGIVPVERSDYSFSSLFVDHSDYTENLDEFPLYSLTIEDGVTKKTERYERGHLVKKDEAYKKVFPNDFVYNPMNVRFGAVARHKGTSVVSVSGYYDTFSTLVHSDMFFMDYFLVSEKMISYYNAMSTGSLVEKQRVHYSQFKDFCLPLPSEPERIKIAEILSTQDKIIGLKEKLLEQKQEQKKSLMKKLFSPDGETFTLGGVGIDKKGWKKEKLGDICKFIGGGTPPTKNSSYWKGNIPWISSSDLFQDNLFHINISRYITIDAIEKSATHLCPKNSILIITRVGVGKIALAPVELCTSQDFLNITEISANTIFILYLLYFYLQKMASDAQGTSIKGITTDQVKDLYILLPPFPEQQAIAEVLSTADKEIDLLKSDIEQEKQKKKALMQLLLTGIARVKV